ncbi:MAG: Mur ligase family protein [bacterium]|nr:Mur ligase family protein [bacterium]
MTSHIHIIGICGVATGAMAIAFKKAGWKVTGSDKGFFPPVSTELEKAGVEFWAGWHPEYMRGFTRIETQIVADKEGSLPDLVLVGNASGSQNPETAYAKEHDIDILSDAEVRGKFFAKENNIVCAGTWGKTTTTALLSHIFEYAKRDPSFVIGGIPLGFNGAKIGNGSWSIIEGDEYKTSPWDDRPKFAHFPPTHLLLTAVSWDHADMYETESSYFKTFQNLVNSIPDKKNIMANIDDPGVKKVIEGSQVTSYGKSSDSTYRYENVRQDKNGLTFEIVHNNTAHRVISPMLGLYNAENITGAFAMAREFGISPDIIIAAIANFKGLKRRLEKRLEGNLTVIDDIAHSPQKARFALLEIRKIYPEAKIFAVFEPNIGGRRREAAGSYDNAFKDADVVMIPRLTKLKITNNQDTRNKQSSNYKTQIQNTKEPMEGKELAKVINKTHRDVRFIENDGKLVELIQNETRSGDVVVFLGSHGFRGMIEETISKIGGLKNTHK